MTAPSPATARQQPSSRTGSVPVVGLTDPDSRVLALCSPAWATQKLLSPTSEIDLAFNIPWGPECSARVSLLSCSFWLNGILALWLFCISAVRIVVPPLHLFFFFFWSVNQKLPSPLFSLLARPSQRILGSETRRSALNIFVFKMFRCPSRAEGDCSVKGEFERSKCLRCLYCLCGIKT